jgi:hypothetical protein
MKIDYRGWRLVAMSILPLTSSSLCYGSQDSGRSVLASNPEHNETVVLSVQEFILLQMKRVGQKLKLKGHFCGMNKRQFLYAPCDIEGHEGLVYSTSGFY